MPIRSIVLLAILINQNASQHEKVIEEAIAVCLTAAKSNADELNTGATGHPFAPVCIHLDQAHRIVTAFALIVFAFLAFIL